MTDIAGKRVSGIGDDDPKNPGEFCWLGDQHGNTRACLAFMCPCGCGRLGALTIRGSKGEVEHPSWEWDGNTDEPTLTPSIYRDKQKWPENCGWHGFLTKGVWKSC